MNVLVACEESQEVCKAFRALGHEAYSCDIQECSGGHPEWHVVGDCRYLITWCCWICSCDPDIPDEMFGTFKTQDGKRHNLPARWDIIIAHPPCTYISNAGARWLFPNGKLNYERWQKGREGAEFLSYFLNAPCDKIAVENPIPSKIFNIPPYTQVIQPYEYGHPYSKKLVYGLKVCPICNQQKLSQNTSRMFPLDHTARRMTQSTKVRAERAATQKAAARLFMELPKLWRNSGAVSSRRRRKHERTNQGHGDADTVRTL